MQSNPVRLLVLQKEDSRIRVCHQLQLVVSNSPNPHLPASSMAAKPAKAGSKGRLMVASPPPAKAGGKQPAYFL
jgi:hypothetical protein